jgi:hypothetical protein
MNANDKEGVRFNVDSKANDVHIDRAVLDVYLTENEIRQCVSSPIIISLVV